MFQKIVNEKAFCLLYIPFIWEDLTPASEKFEMLICTCKTLKI